MQESRGGRWGEREPSRTAGAHPIGESNLDYRKFMGVWTGMCVRVRVTAYALSAETRASERASGAQRCAKRCLRSRNTEIIQRACFRKDSLYERIYFVSFRQRDRRVGIRESERKKYKKRGLTK